MGDSLRVYRLQRRGTSLAPERDLTHPATPLLEAWLAFVTQQAMGQPAYVACDPHDGEAFLQLAYRPHQAAADIAYLAPSLAEGRCAVRLWPVLVDGACADVAARGIQRVFANLPEPGGEVELFHQAGFSLYAGEDIYCLARPAARPRGDHLPALRAQHLEDLPALQKLCVAITPQRVRQAEGGIAAAADAGLYCERWVLPAGAGDELAAALALCRGPAASWLRLLVHPEQRPPVERLIEHCLALLGADAARPVYCTVRRYEGGVRGGLEAAGFEPVAARALMVKHTAAYVKTQAAELVPALKAGAEPLPPAYHIQGEPDLRPSSNRLASKS